jgi:hypothetical protein
MDGVGEQESISFVRARVWAPDKTDRQAGSRQIPKMSLLTLGPLAESVLRARVSPRFCTFFTQLATKAHRHKTHK